MYILFSNSNEIKVFYIEFIYFFLGYCLLYILSHFAGHNDYESRSIAVNKIIGGGK